MDVQRNHVRIVRRFQMMNEMISTADLCKKLGVSRQTVYKWRKQGMPVALNNNFQGGRTIRYKLDDIMKWLNDKNWVSNEAF